MENRHAGRTRVSSARATPRDGDKPRTADGAAGRGASAWRRKRRAAAPSEPTPSELAAEPAEAADLAASQPAVSEASAAHNAQPADDVLVARSQSGDEAAFALLIERHQRAIYGYLRARVLEPADAEDLCQEVFLRCYQMPATFVSPMMVRPWLLGIARNVLREHIRKLSRRKEIAWTSLCLEVDACQCPEDDRYDEVVSHLPDCLDALGPSARDALDMYYRSKLRLAQIGERLRRSEGAVKLLMFRARQALKTCLSRKTGCPIRE